MSGRRPRIPGYELIRPLGGGLLTCVFEARECGTDTACAVKVLREDWQDPTTALKLLQREDALSRGIELIEWTFDPLEIKNSYLNIERLGAISRRYTINQYGITSSPLQGGLPSDRLIAEWWLKSRRVETLLASGNNPSFQTEAAVEVPAQIYDWKAATETRGKAQQVQERNRKQFLQAFDSGLAVLGYDRDAEGNGKFLFGKWDEMWSYASQ